MARQLALILLSAAAVLADVPFQDCGSSYSLLSVDIDGCNNTHAPCSMILGQRVNVTIEFLSGFRSESLSPEVYFTLLGVQREARVSPTNCQNLQSMTCPIQAGHVITYRAELKVDENLVPTQGDLTWILYSETHITLVCMRTGIHLFVPPEPLLKGRMDPWKNSLPSY